MRTPELLQPLVEHGLVDRVVRALKSGKEAQVYLVESQGEIRVAKIYKDADHRSFKNRSTYTEGRQVRKSRDQRAIGRRSSYGREQDEAAWRIAESEIISKLYSAGARVPQPHVFFEGVLLMEYICDEAKEPAPRLAELELTLVQRERLFKEILEQVVIMLFADIVHGDLSLFNILMSKQGHAVIIDFPQAVDAAVNPNAKELLVRDLDSLTRELMSHQKGFENLNYGEELWELYRSAELTPDTLLTGHYEAPEIDVDTANILAEIAYFEEQERKKREALGLDGYGKKKRHGAPTNQKSDEEPTGHEEMERMAKYWDDEEKSQTAPKRRRGHRHEQSSQSDDASSGSRRRRGRPKRRKNSD